MTCGLSARACLRRPTIKPVRKQLLERPSRQPRERPASFGIDKLGNPMTPRLFRPRQLAAGLTLGLAALAAMAHEFTLGSLTIGHPYARPTVPGQSVGGGFLTIANQGADDRLLSATSAGAHSVELHTMSMDGDVMRMRQVDGLNVPAGKTVDLKPGAVHLMFMGLKAPLKAGDKLPVTLKFAKAGEVAVVFNVDAPAPSAELHKH